MACVSNSILRLRASWDIVPNSVTIPRPGRSNKTPSKRVETKPAPTSLKIDTASVTDLLKLGPLPTQGKTEELYLGYDRWLPVAPKMKKPRSIYNAASLAYMGDCIYELYARRHFLFPPLSIEEYNSCVMAVVRCEAQDVLLKKLLEDDYLSEAERDVLRWGKNIGSGKTRTKKRAGVAVYNRASSLETLVGFLYLTDMKRLEDVMMKLGFTTGASSERMVAE